MKHLFTLILVAVFSCLGTYAQESSAADGTRYITMTDGQVVAIPEKYILDEVTENGVCVLYQS